MPECSECGKVNDCSTKHRRSKVNGWACYLLSRGQYWICRTCLDGLHERDLMLRKEIAILRSDGKFDQAERIKRASQKVKKLKEGKRIT